MFSQRMRIFAVIVLTVPCASVCAVGQDWPMWRFDEERAAASTAALIGEVNLQWVLHFAPRVPVWDDPLNQDLMHYDEVFEPIVLDKTLFLGFNDSDKVVAFDTDTGEERWRFYTDGPVRLPGVAFKGTVLYACDDGYLYCVDAADGTLRWKFRGGPSERKVLGNKRLISTWPMRGGPVVKDGIVYCAASIWPFMGTFIYALDAETGEIVWSNDSTSNQFILQPHNNPAFAGVAPQGAFVIDGSFLLVPGGRSVPACFDLATGKSLYYRLASSGKTGGAFVCAGGGVFFNHHRDDITTMYDLAEGQPVVRSIGRYPVLGEDTFYLSGKSIVACRYEDVLKNPKEWRTGALWECPVDASGDLIKAGDRLFAAGDGKVTAVDLAPGEDPGIAWAKEVDGEVRRLIVADGKLFAVTLDGRVMAFGPGPAEARLIERALGEPRPGADAVERVKTILAETGVSEGYALVYGVGDGGLPEALALESELLIVAVDPDAEKVSAARKRLDAAGLCGTRVAVHQGDALTFEPPQYMVSLTVVADLDAAGFESSGEFLARLFKPMRPYGGMAWLPLDGSEQRAFLSVVKESGLPGAKAAPCKGGLLLSREGPLPGAGTWTHQYGNVANTVKSDDDLVKMPLGLLWFGGNPNTDVLPRHGHGPPEQVIGGRLFIEGMGCISARDVYTGRVLWKTDFGDLGAFGVYYDKTYKDAPTDPAYNQVHIPGANIRGTNFVATLDKVYVLQGADCHVLDAAKGEKLATFQLPSRAGQDGAGWGYIGVYENVLIGGSGFVPFSHIPTDGQLSDKEEDAHKSFYRYDKSASRELVVMDRHTGDVLWTVEARHGFPHNGIAVGKGTVYCLDKLPPYVEQFFRRRGKGVPETYRLLALDVDTGKVKWKMDEDVFGTWLGYSGEHDVLLQSTRPSSDTVSGESGKRMIVYSVKKGKVLWDVSRGYSNPPILHGNRIITHSKMYDLLTGEQVFRSNPLTGERIPWTYERTKGCNYHIASEHLITFRSSAAGYFDLDADGGTGHFGGFKSGCTSTLIAADGVLNAPDYTRTCSCSYQNQTSVALVHDPDVEVWTTYPAIKSAGPIQRLGINLGASGDRKAADGTLWLEYPVIAGTSPDVAVNIGEDSVEWITHHSSLMLGDGPRWIGSSAAEGLTDLDVTLRPDGGDEQAYTVRLYFAELRGAAVGERVFSVALQGGDVLVDFDIAKEAGGPWRTVSREFKGVQVQDVLAIRFVPSAAARLDKSLLCGVAVAAE